MSSFLANCPQCGCTFASGAPCPSCRWVDETKPIDFVEGEYCDEFAIRSRRQKRNTTIQMMVLAGTGFISFATAVMWALFLFRGNVFAFIAVGFLTIVAGVLWVCTYLAKSKYPTSLACPGCSSDLSDLGMDFNDCPACGANLVARDEFLEQGSAAPAQESAVAEEELTAV